MKPKPEVRDRVRALAESQWPWSTWTRSGPPSTYRADAKDGTVKGKRLVRRFFRNIVRGVIGVPIDIVLSIADGGAASLSNREGKVTGPENAQALGLVDAAMSADSPWLAHSPRTWP